MKEAPQVGFAKIIWKALGLPAAFCLLKRAQEAKGLLCPEQPDPSILMQPISLTSSLITGLRLEHTGQ